MTSAQRPWAKKGYKILSTLKEFRIKIKELIKNNVEISYWDEETKQPKIKNKGAKAVEEFLKHSYYIYGTTGTGKTMTVQMLDQNFRKVEYVKWYILASEILNEEVKNKPINKRWYGITDRMLIIDDIGAKILNETNVDLLFEIIDWRAENNFPTTITSNFSIKELYEKLKLQNEDKARRIISRLSKYEKVQAFGRDYRMKPLTEQEKQAIRERQKGKI